MASTGGLTRRRGGGGGGGGGGSAGDEADRSGSPSTSRPAEPRSGGGETSFTTENGHKIGEFCAFFLFLSSTR